MKLSLSARVSLCVVIGAVGLLAGGALFHVHAPTVTTAEAQPAVWTDSFNDGTPDFLRLTDGADRLAFRTWFTYLAESAYFSKQPPEEVNDCAALIRYSYREALRAHDAAWASNLRLSHVPPMPAVAKYSYPHTPLGAELFRTRAGDVSRDAFGQFADADALRTWNAHFISRNIRRARPGDLFFYRQPNQHMPYHAMIFIGPSQLTRGNDRWVVYHTGPEGSAPGEIRRVTMAELLRHPDARWRPLPSNPAFLGVYRWNILRGAQ